MFKGKKEMNKKGKENNKNNWVKIIGKKCSVEVHSTENNLKDIVGFAQDLMQEEGKKYG